jgi:hypothetical protein
MQRRCLNGLRKDGFFSIPSVLALIRGYGVLTTFDQYGIKPQWSMAYYHLYGDLRATAVFTDLLFDLIEYIILAEKLPKLMPRLGEEFWKAWTTRVFKQLSGDLVAT